MPAVAVRAKSTSSNSASASGKVCGGGIARLVGLFDELA
jgi:hypothetical protein